MTKQDYSFLQSAIQQLFATRPGAWLSARTGHHLDRAFLKLSGNRFTLSSLLTGFPVVSLTTTGARSGRPRTVPLLAFRKHPGAAELALVASNWGQERHPAWYYNLKANPRATCVVAGQGGEYLAHEAHGQEYERYWRLATETYFGYARYRERISSRHIPIMVLTPVTQTTHGPGS